MLINQAIINDLCDDAGEARTAKARAYQRQGRVKINYSEYEDENNFEVSADVIRFRKISYLCTGEKC